MERTTSTSIAVTSLILCRHHTRQLPQNLTRSASSVLRKGTRRQMSSSTTPPHRSLNINNINPHVKAAKYAVRGELAVRAEKYRQALSRNRPLTQPDDQLPFDSVVSANIGNPQQLDQKPITFFRQVASILENPELLEHSHVLLGSLGYKQDVLDRARWLLNDVKSVGAYSQSQGPLGIRQSITRFIQGRSENRVKSMDVY